MAWTFPYGEQFKDYINPSTVIVSRDPGQTAKNVELMYNDFTHDIEGMKLTEAESAFPVGSPNEAQWENMINTNLWLEIRKSIIENIMGPVIEKASYGATGIMDILTLGVFGFNKGHKNISKTVTEQIVDKYVTKRKVFAVIGVPEEAWASPVPGKTPFPAPGGAMSGFKKYGRYGSDEPKGYKLNAKDMTDILYKDDIFDNRVYNDKRIFSRN